MELYRSGVQFFINRLYQLRTACDFDTFQESAKESLSLEPCSTLFHLARGSIDKFHPSHTAHPLSPSSIVGIANLEFTKEYDILAMMSSEKEKVDLTSSISTSEARGAVEKWLLQVNLVF